jgi:hypothetical protein
MDELPALWRAALGVVAAVALGAGFGALLTFLALR